MAVTKASAGQVTLTWSSSCSILDVDYEIYEGTLGDFDSHTPSYCSTAGATTRTFMPRTGDVYFLVAPRTPESEGSQGRGSDSVEREGLIYCVPRELGACP